MNIFYLICSLFLIASSNLSYGDILDEQKFKIMSKNQLFQNPNPFGRYLNFQEKKCKKHRCPTGPTGPKGHKGKKGETGLSGSTGPTGAMGPAGGSAFAASYGRLSVTPRNINITDADTWISIPFDSFSPSSNMSGSTISPARMTVQQSGVYQMNVALYFSFDESNEGTFTETNYILGVSFSGNSQISVGAVYANVAGFYSINYNDLLELNVDDYVQFFIQASAVGGDSSYDNHVAIESGNASLVQISN